MIKRNVNTINFFPIASFVNFFFSLFGLQDLLQSGPSIDWSNLPLAWPKQSPVTEPADFISSRSADPLVFGHVEIDDLWPANSVSVGLAYFPASGSVGLDDVRPVESSPAGLMELWGKSRLAFRIHVSLVF